MATLHWADAGFLDMLGVYFRGITAPAGFALRLVHDTIVGTDNWADISANELPSANGYTTGGVAINRDDTAAGFPALARLAPVPFIHPFANMISGRQQNTSGISLDSSRVCNLNQASGPAATAY